MRALLSRAEAAGEAAAKAAVPVPIRVTERVDPFNDNSAIKTDYGVYTEGVCGFAWIEVHPANSRIANAIKARYATSEGGSARLHAGNAWPKGLSVWVGGYGQSMARKEAYSSAYSAVLREAGFNAYGASRMD
jgi:hypothetical protein